MDDVLANKSTVIERCILRIQEEYEGHENEFKTNYTQQDSIVLNIQRACEAAIDMATRMIRQHHLGLPQNSRDVFQLLVDGGLISEELSCQLKAMVGFRNIAVHDYQSLNLDIVRSIIENDLDMLLEYTEQLLSYDPNNK